MKTLKYVDRNNEECTINLDAIECTNKSEYSYTVVFHNYHEHFDFEKDADIIRVITNYLQDHSISK
jgi:hypothetical protein